MAHVSLSLHEKVCLSVFKKDLSKNSSMRYIMSLSANTDSREFGTAIPLISSSRTYGRVLPGSQE